MNADEDRPDGSVRFTKFAEYIFQDPQYDTNGNQTGSTTRVIPRFKRTVTLSAQSQILYDQQQQTTEELNALAFNLAQQINTGTATRFDLNGLPSRGVAVAAPNLVTTTPTPGALVRGYGAIDGGEAEKARVRDAIDDRLQWQIERDRQARIHQLDCMGISPGSEAWERDLMAFDRQSTDARIQAYIAASGEHERLENLERNRAEFANNVQQMEFQQQVLVIELGNREKLRLFQALQSLAEFADTQRAKAIQERVLERSTTMNEISALIHGNRVEMPQFQQFKAQPMEAAPVGQYIYQTAAIQQDQWKTMVQVQMQKHAQKQAFMGQMIGLGGGLLGRMMTGGFGG